MARKSRRTEGVGSEAPLANESPMTETRGETVPAVEKTVLPLNTPFARPRKIPLPRLSKTSKRSPASYLLPVLAKREETGRKLTRLRESLKPP
jgi:hypothetical protein